MIVCKECGTGKPKSEFYWHKSGRRMGCLKDRRCKKCAIARAAKRYREMYAASRKAALEHYSGAQPSCDCCGEDHIEFLVMDHIDGGGNKHREEVGSIVIWIVRNNFPPGFRVLCSNCNHALGIYGACPHKDGPSEATS